MVNQGSEQPVFDELWVNSIDRSPLPLDAITNITHFRCQTRPCYSHLVGSLKHTRLHPPFPFPPASSLPKQ